MEIWPSCFCTVDERIQLWAEFFNYCFVLGLVDLGQIGCQLKAGHLVISRNYVGCILCTIVVHRMHPTDMLCQFCTIDVLR